MGKRARLFGAVLAALIIVGCSVRGHYGYATAPPPPLRMEAYGVAPGPGLVWVGGYWRWVGRDYEWTSGALGTPSAAKRAVGARLLGAPAEPLPLARRPLAGALTR